MQDLRTPYTKASGPEEHQWGLLRCKTVDGWPAFTPALEWEVQYTQIDFSHKSEPHLNVTATDNRAKLPEKLFSHRSCMGNGDRRGEKRRGL